MIFPGTGMRRGANPLKNALYRSKLNPGPCGVYRYVY